MRPDASDRRRFLRLVLAAPFASALIAQLAGGDEAEAAEAGTWTGGPKASDHHPIWAVLPASAPAVNAEP